jgi:hypothetical protein
MAEVIVARAPENHNRLREDSMPVRGVGIDGPDLGGGPDLAAVGNAARASKRTVDAPQELESFSVKKGDNGGVIVSETYKRTTPAGRRPASFLLGGGDYKENPFSPDDGAAAQTHITGLLSEMGVRVPEAPSAGGAPAMQGGPDLSGPDLGGGGGY